MKKYELVDIIVGIINLFTGLSVLALAVRFFFRLFGANPESSIVSFIYTSTAPLMDPFREIFTPAVIEPGSVLEFSSLIAIVFYLVMAYLLVSLIEYVAYSTTTYRRTAR